GGVPVRRLIDGLVASIGRGARNKSRQVLDSDWWDLSLRDCEKELRSIVGIGISSAVAEPELHDGLWPQMRGGQPSDISSCLHDSAMMYLLSVSRLRRLLGEHGEDAWLGDRTKDRLPPAKLSSTFSEGIDSGTSVAEFLRQILRE